MKIIQRSITLIIIIGIIALTLAFQQRIFFNWDVSWLLHCTQQLLAGKHYFTDFFESNPPLILYLYCAPVLLAKIMGVTLFNMFHYYVLSLTALSLGLCAYLLQKNQLRYRHLLLIILALIFCLLPSYEFGQKDVLMIIFFMPYLLLINLQLHKKTTPRWCRIVLPIFATLGLAIKPYFLLSLIFIELYVAYHKRSLRSLLRLENYIIVAGIVIYLISIYFIAPNYYTHMLPFVWHDYVGLHPNTISSLFHTSYTFIILLSAALTFIFKRTSAHFSLLMLLTLSSLGFFLVFLYEGEMWYYHIYPAFALASFCLSIMFIEASLKLAAHGYAGDRIIRAAIAFWLGLLCLIPTTTTYQLGKAHIAFKENPKSTLHQLINTTTKLAGTENFMVFSTSFDIAQIINNNSSAHFVGRFPYYLYVVGVMQDDLQNKHKAFAKRAADIILSGTRADLQRYQPKLLIVDMRAHKPYSKGINISFLDFLQQDTAIKKMLRQYHRVKQIDGFSFYLKQSATRLSTSVHEREAS